VAAYVTTDNPLKYAAFSDPPVSRLPRTKVSLPKAVQIHGVAIPTNKMRASTHRDPHDRVPNTANPEEPLGNFSPQHWIQE